MVWENVPGAFSSNKGEDFRIVLEETAKVADKNAVIPMPESGKWTTSGCIVGDGWSIAWRVFDAQFWGVPQRRRRIALVADFGGESAPEILFVRKSLSGHTEPSQSKRKETASDASRSLGADDSEGTVAYTMQDREGKDGGGKGALIAEELSATLRANNAQYLFQPCSWDGGQTSPTLTARNASGCQRMPDKDNFNAVIQPVYSVENHPADSRVDIDESGKVQTLTSRMGTGGGNVPMVMQCFSKSKRAQTDTDYETWKESDTTNTLNSFDVGDVRTTEVVVALDRASFNQGKNAKFDFEVSENGINSPIVAKGPSAVCYGIGSYDSNAWKSGNPYSGVYEADTARTLDAINCGYPACNQGGTAVVEEVMPQGINGDKAGTLDSSYYKGCGMRSGVERDIVAVPLKTRYIVRRLTPLECERLQGFPDGWTDIGEYTDTKGKKGKASDAARYKALGNSIALPSWKWVLKRLCACYERDATMASLFDGIGGFPLLWEQINGKGACLWASEIEEFPIAVTKARIGE
jgi:DNA (cytosine-5)-methyltransferase 1